MFSKTVHEGGGGQKSSKNGPHGLCMPPIYNLHIPDYIRNIRLTICTYDSVVGRIAVLNNFFLGLFHS